MKPSKLLKDTALDTVHTMRLGAETIGAAAKRQWEIRELHRALDQSFHELGQLLYATHTGSPTGSGELLEKMEAIDALKTRLRELEGEPILHLLCPRCGHEVRPEDAFCQDCGQKL